MSAVSVQGKSHSESIRIGAKKCQDGGEIPSLNLLRLHPFFFLAVLFSHRSAFPVVFHKRVIDKWLGSSIRFLVYSRARVSQKQVHPSHSVFFSEFQAFLISLRFLAKANFPLDAFYWRTAFNFLRLFLFFQRTDPPLLPTWK